MVQEEAPFADLPLPDEEEDDEDYEPGVEDFVSVPDLFISTKNCRHSLLFALFVICRRTLLKTHKTLLHQHPMPIWTLPQKVTVQYVGFLLPR